MNFSQINKKIFKVSIILFVIFASFAVGYLVSHIKNNKIKEQEKISNLNKHYQERENTNYKFINPLLECEIAEGTIDSKKQNFEKDLNTLIKEKIVENKLSKMSVYFRDLNNGPTFGVNENELFLPASLLKMPIMMAYFLSAESDPDILKKEIEFEKIFEIPNEKVQIIKPSQAIEIGNTYTVEQLIEALIKYSDNQAVSLLINNISDKKILEIFKLLGVESEYFEKSEEMLSVKQYSRFFRILFNSSFLGRYYSEKSLKLLSEVEYKNALVAGVPKEIVVSHKFGEGSQDGEQQLHDCGIIYYPKHPYLLCIMSRGKKLSDLENSISNVSSFIYKKIAEQYN